MATSSEERVPIRAWVVTLAGMSVNLCLGILYAWSVWKSKLTASKDQLAGSPMGDLDTGWLYLTDAQATWAYVICGITFALFMIPGGKVQDRFGPKVGATAAGLFLAAGCILAGVMKSYTGLIVGFGLLGGIGMGLGYAAATPAAVKWFGPHRRGLIVGIVVGGFGAAAIYISPLATFLINNYGISGSFIGLGVFFGIVIVVAGQLLSWPPTGYVPPGALSPGTLATRVLPPATNSDVRTALTKFDWSAANMLRTWQFYALVALFIGSSQSGLLVIANATAMMKDNPTGKELAWLLPAFGGLINALGRIGTGVYSDKVGRANAYLINGVISAGCLLLMPAIIGLQSVWLLFLAVGIAYWQYGGGLSLMPAMTADFFGSKNLGFNYGLVFIGWGIAFLMPQLGGYIKDQTASLDLAFYISGGLLIAAVVLSRFVHRPLAPEEGQRVVTR